MRIFLSGAHRTGKTTLAKALADELGMDYFDAKVSDFMADRGFAKVEDHVKNNDYLEQYLTQTTLSNYLIKRFTSANNYVCDRGMIDVIVYNMLYASRLPPEKESIQRAYYDLCDGLFQEYAMIGKRTPSVTFLIQTNDEIPFVEADKSAGADTQKHFQEIMMRVFPNSAEDIVVVPKEVVDLQHRVNFCKEKVLQLRRTK